MDITELILKKLNYNLTSEEDAHFKNWINESEPNKSIFFRLKKLKKVKYNFPKKMNVDINLAWSNVLKKLT